MQICYTVTNSQLWNTKVIYSVRKLAGSLTCSVIATHKRRLPRWSREAGPLALDIELLLGTWLLVPVSPVLTINRGHCFPFDGAGLRLDTVSSFSSPYPNWEKAAPSTRWNWRARERSCTQEISVIGCSEAPQGWHPTKLAASSS